MKALSQVEQIHRILVEKFGGSYGIRDRGILLSALSRPYQTFEAPNMKYSLLQDHHSVAFFLFVVSILASHG